jgi:hypothetical protein
MVRTRELKHGFLPFVDLINKMQETFGNWAGKCQSSIILRNGDTACVTVACMKFYTYTLTAGCVTAVR